MAWLLTNYKLIGYALAAIAIAVLIQRVNAWHSGYEREKETAKLLVIRTAERDAEVNCIKGSRCVDKLFQQAEKYDAAIAQSQKEADAKADRDRKDQEQRQKAYEAKNAKNLAARDASYKDFLDKIKSHPSLACKDTEHVLDPCLADQH